ncbi:MAG: hydrogenase maturation protease [Rubrobacteridae bacterium]|nr:hydrogenase maturation protease [Rubrobacteridae bacterium]
MLKSLKETNIKKQLSVYLGLSQVNRHLIEKEMIDAAMGAWYRMESPTSRVLIIGYGNPLCGDDGVGWFVASSVEDILSKDSISEHVEIITSHQLMPEFAETISGHDLVIFIDACCDRGVGVVNCRQIESNKEYGTDGMNHQMDPSALLAYAKTLYGACPEALFYTVGGVAFDFGESMTRPVKCSAQFVIESIVEIVRRRCFKADNAPVC